MEIAVIGAGNRARKYLSCLPEGVHVRCLVEPDPLRLRQTAARYGVPPDGCFSSADDFFSSATPTSSEDRSDKGVKQACRLHKTDEGGTECTHELSTAEPLCLEAGAGCESLRQLGIDAEKAMMRIDRTVM